MTLLRWRSRAVYVTYLIGLAASVLAFTPARAAACTYQACYPPYPGGDCGTGGCYQREMAAFEDSDCYYCQLGECVCYDPSNVQCFNPPFEVCLYPK